jgi:hypothetical protein
MTQTAEFVGPGVFYDGFGWGVGVSGDTIVVTGAGPAYVYVRPGTGWANMVATATLDDNTGAYGNGGVAISGNTIVIGYNGCCDEGNPFNGQVDVFVKPAGGWATSPPPAAILTATNETQEDFFGTTVAISGNAVIVGSPYHQFHTGHDGAAYIFVMPAYGWSNMTETAQLAAPQTVQLGSSVAISSQLALAVDHLTGIVYAYAMPSTGWSTTGQPVAQFTGASSYAQGIAVQGRTIVIGSVGASVNGVAEGAAFVY